MRRINPSLAVFIALSLSTTGASGGEHAKPKGSPPKRPPTSLKSWVMVDPFTISVIQDGAIRGTFTVNFGMDVPDATLRDKAETLMPRLRDAWLRSLNLYASTSLRRGGRPTSRNCRRGSSRRPTTCSVSPAPRCLMAQAVVDIPAIADA